MPAEADPSQCILVRSLSRIATPVVRAVAIGNFDGLHRGHQYLIRHLCEAKLHNPQLRTTVVTFSPHPIEVLRPGVKVSRIASVRQMLAALTLQGVDELYVQRFDREFASWSAERFLGELIVDGLKAERVIVGEDAHVGRDREGSVARIADILASRKIGLTVVPFINEHGHKIGSREIRTAIDNGDLATAKTLLGRPFSIMGRVKGGDRRGRQLGFPTANIIPARTIMPPNGVYATIAVVGGEIYPAVTNVGVRPTFAGSTLTIETHILQGFSREIYGEIMEVFFIASLRPERRFSALGELERQIAYDISCALVAIDADSLNEVGQWLRVLHG